MLRIRPEFSPHKAARPGAKRPRHFRRASGVTGGVSGSWNKCPASFTGRAFMPRKPRRLARWLPELDLAGCGRGLRTDAAPAAEAKEGTRAQARLMGAQRSLLPAAPGGPVPHDNALRLGRCGLRGCARRQGVACSPLGARQGSSPEGRDRAAGSMRSTKSPAGAAGPSGSGRGSATRLGSVDGGSIG